MAATPNAPQTPQSYEGPYGERYMKVFICHGCQTCWEIVDDGSEDGMLIQHRHVLGAEDVTDQIKQLEEKAAQYDGLCK